MVNLCICIVQSPYTYLTRRVSTFYIVQVLYVPIHNLQSMLSLQSALYKGRTYIVHNFQSIYTVQSTFEYLQCMTSLLQKWPRLMVPVLLNSHPQGKLGTKAATADLEGSSSTRRVP